MDQSAPNIAAVDLGSNSFHMLIARHSDHDMRIIDRIKEPVYLAGGLDANGGLSDEAQARALACLERFGQRLRGLESDHVRAVGTNTFRRVRGATGFRARAEQALGHRIEIIPGHEEARLIYLGVAHTQPSDPSPRLVVDIGGGSTEVIIGDGFEILRAHSLFMGCVNYSSRFFPDGVVKREAFKRAETAAGVELHAVASGLKRIGWESAIGASGTINALYDTLRVLGNGAAGVATLSGLKRLRKMLVAAGHVEKASLPELKPERARVLAGGLAILIAVFKSLDVDAMSASTGALREGLVYDLLGRIHHEDVRDRTITRLVEQYRIDLGQTTRVERTAGALFERIGAPAVGEDTPPRRLLSWASRLHEIGLAVSHTGHHKHGAYLIANSDLPGFSADEQRLLATVIRNQRRKPEPELIAAQGRAGGELTRRLTVIMRLAVLLNRGRTTQRPMEIVSDAEGRKIEFRVAHSWRLDHPLTVADLEDEARHLQSLGVVLTVVDKTPADTIQPPQP